MVVELCNSRILVPLVEVNPFGLISNVTSRRPLRKPTVRPVDPICPSEGLFVCVRERIKGKQSVSVDELIRICIENAHQMDALGVDRMAVIAERLSSPSKRQGRCSCRFGQMKNVCFFKLLAVGIMEEKFFNRQILARSINLLKGCRRLSSCKSALVSSRS